MDIPTIDQAIALRPGDTVLVRVATRTTTEAALMLQESLRERLGDVNVQVVAAEAITVVNTDQTGTGADQRGRSATTPADRGRSAQPRRPAPARRRDGD